MQIPVLSSTVFLTILLAIGLFFFIRASTKDRIQVVQLVSEQPETSLLEQLQQYFTQRAYRIANVDAAKNLVTFEGFVRPSFFLTVFLSLLAGIGILSLVVMFSVLAPSLSPILPWALVFAPLAGLFYWQKAGRQEQVSLRVESVAEGGKTQQLVTVTGHRDELAELQRSLSLTALESEA